MKEVQITPGYVFYLLNRYWILILSFFILGGIGAFCFNQIITPLYRSEISIFTWNRSITDAIHNIKGQKTSKTDEVLMYNNIISQSLYLGQRLINDYTMIMNNPQVKKETNENLIKKGFHPPLKYSFKCMIKRQSCIMKISVESPDPKLASEAANSLVTAFKNEQERLMNLKYAQEMHPATTPNSPFYPRKKLNLFIGLFLGFLVGGGIAFLIDLKDMTIKNPDDLKQRNMLPLGIIPFYPNIAKLCETGDQKNYKRLENSILDSIRIISTTISFLKIDNPPKTIQFTSALPGVGKSTLVLLLSKILGAGNKKVLIMDCDLRRPRIYKNIKLTKHTGIVNYLADSDSSKPERYIQSEIFPNVDLMTHGIIPPNPTELLGSNKFASLLEKLKPEYDCILMDSPPCSGMADAMVIGNSADAIVIMAESGKTKIHDIIRTMEQFDSLKEKVIGAVLNKVNFKKNKEYYYSYGYGYGYGYGYYYHSDDTDEKVDFPIQIVDDQAS